jgi:hypothetical protein
MPAPPVTTSVTFALFNNVAPWDSLAPFMLIKPSGPRTTPGINGRRVSKRSFAFGAFFSVDSWITSRAFVSAGSSSFCGRRYGDLLLHLYDRQPDLDLCRFARFDLHTCWSGFEPGEGDRYCM